MRSITCCFFLLWGFLFCTDIFSQQKINYQIQSEGVQREYIVYLPSSYDPTEPTPLVFMLHGTGGDGERMFLTSGWAELAEKEGFIAVFPSSLRYRITENGENKNITKWNITPDAGWEFQEGETGKNDITFLRKVVEEITGNYTIDRQKIYLNGFSNGGAMAARCSIEMSDILAAVCSNASAFLLDTVYVPKRNIPVLFQVGDRDYGPGNVGPEIPMVYFDSILTDPNISVQNGKHYRIARNFIRNFSYNEQFTVSGDSNNVLMATYLPFSPQDHREFRYIMVKGLAHSYPDWAPLAHWSWMKQYTNQSVTNGFTLTVEDGYGSGQYEEGEIIHLWAKQSDNKVFTHWEGDISDLHASDEYHVVLKMPAKNVSLKAIYADLLPHMEFEQRTIKGAERDKKVFVYLPPDIQNIKGLAWFFHGTNGNASQMITDPDTRQMMHLLMVNHYGVVALTSEESEFNLDFDNDGFYRYTYGVDSMLLDIANVRAIRDVFISENKIKNNTKHIAIGWSAGGAFSEFIANSLHWAAAINHTSAGNMTLSLSELVTVPYLAAINENDTHPAVGPSGNEQARVNVMNYKNRDACTVLHEQKKAPLFPERFDRSFLISENLSRSVFNELKINNGLDSNNYLKLLAGPLSVFVANNPAKFPVILGLSPLQREAVLKQIEVTNAEHSFKADINGMTLRFIEEACNSVATEDSETESTLVIYPNPANDQIFLNKECLWSLHQLNGQKISEGHSNMIDVFLLPNGIYILKTLHKNFKIIKLNE